MKKLTFLFTINDNHKIKKITSKVMEVTENNSIINPRHNWNDKEYKFYDDLYLHSYLSSVESIFDLEYVDCFTVTLIDAKCMYKTLSKIQKTELKIEDSLGKPKTYGDRLSRIAMVLNITSVYFIKSENHISSYQDMTFDIVEIGLAKDKIDRIIQNLIKK